MKVLLLYPEFPDTFWSFKHALKFIRKKSASPPLGLLTVAAMLPDEWEKRLVDLNVSWLNEHDLNWPDCVFISGMAIQRDSARELISRCKAKGLPVVAGGPLFTYEHQQFPEVDHFILNEAELTLPDFLKDLETGRPKKTYTTTDYADINQTPVPLWELLDIKRYGSMSIQFSRGCPFQCEFCNITALLGHKVRVKTVEQIITELDSLYAIKWRASIFFVDDNFIGNKRFIKKNLLPALIKWRQDKPNISFFTETSINLADDEELMDLMGKAGFESVFIGIETPEEESLNECLKKQNQNRDLIKDVKRIQRAGIEVQAGFIVGFDNDTFSIFERQIDFIQKSGIVTAMVGLLQAPSGTRLYDRLLKEGRLLGNMTGDNVDGDTNIIPAMGLERLKDGYDTILDHIYSPKFFYRRVKTFLREYKPAKIRTKLDFQHKMAFFRSILHLGILGKERFYYWQLICWTMIFRPRLLSYAVTLSIYGHHFKKVCELNVSRFNEPHDTLLDNQF